MPGGFEVGTQIVSKLSRFALHLSNHLPLLVCCSSCPFKLVTQPTNALEAFREFCALIDGLLLIHRGSIAPPFSIVTKSQRTSCHGNLECEIMYQME